MDDIYYLIHTTDDPNFMNWSELKVSDKNSFIYTDNEQYPGVYFSIVTKQNIDYLSLYPGKYILFFTRDILFQSNYHINFYDHNGMITEHNTFYPWNIEQFLEKQNEFINNVDKVTDRFTSEVIFHDNISIQHLCSYMEKPRLKIDYKNDTIDTIFDKIYSLNSLLPRKTFTLTSPIQYKNNCINHIPFYCYPFENIYPVETKFEKSSLNWYKMMAKICDIQITEEDSISTIQEKIQYESKNIHRSRERQNLEVLRNYSK
jgi:hypothetical protein